MGAFASRVTVMTGAAVTMAAAKLRREMLAVAGRLLQSAPELLSVVVDRMVVRDAPDGPSLDLAAIARGAGGEIVADATFTTEHMTYPYGAHLAQVRVERDSCAIVVERFFVGYDIGRAINPMLVEGQIAGGVAQGIGGVLYEHLAYDEDGNPLATTLMDYLVPSAAELPPIEYGHIETPSPGPGGHKGVGEGGAIGAPPAVVNAVADALAPFGVTITRLPLTPSRIVALLNEGPRD
jgi:carbon-monoxide dehydrogenase large subunit